MVAAINRRAVSVLPIHSHEISTELIVMAPPVNWRCPQLDPLSSSDMSGEFGLASSIRERKAAVVWESSPFLNSGLTANGTRGKLSKRVSVVCIVSCTALMLHIHTS